MGGEAAEPAPAEARWAGPGGGEARGLLLGPRPGATLGAAGSAVLVIPGEPGLGPRGLGLARRIAGAGHVALLVDPYTQAGEAQPSDRRALAELEAALRWLGGRAEVDEQRIAAAGFGAGGTLAFQLGCTSTRVAAVVDVAGPPLHPELSAARPIQPLELVLNLDRPLLAVFGGEDPSVPAEHVALLRAALEAGSKDFELASIPRAGAGFFHGDRPDYHGAAEDAWDRVLRFLEGVLRPPPSAPRP